MHAVITEHQFSYFRVGYIWDTKFYRSVLLLLRTYALDFTFVVVVSLVAPAAVSAYRVLAPPILTHSRKLLALVDVFSFDEPKAARTHFRKRRRTLSRTRFAFLAPSFPDRRATAQILVENPVNGMSALSVLVSGKALLLPHVQALCSWKITSII